MKRIGRNEEIEVGFVKFGNLGLFKWLEGGQIDFQGTRENLGYKSLDYGFLTYAK